MKIIVWSILGLLLTACSTPQLPVTQESYELAARLQQQNSRLTAWDITANTSITAKDSSYSLSVFWQQDGKNFDLRFDAPFATGVLRIKGNAEFAELTLENKKTIRGDTPEQLIKEVTPFDIPVTGLIYWIRGIPHKNAQNTTVINAYGDTKTIRQDGWLIRYDDWKEVTIQSHVYRLPHKILLDNDALQIKIKPSGWVKKVPLKSHPLFSDLDR